MRNKKHFTRLYLLAAFYFISINVINNLYKNKNGTSLILMNDRAEKLLHMSLTCSGETGVTRVFCCIFEIQILLRSQFLAGTQG